MSLDNDAVPKRSFWSRLFGSANTDYESESVPTTTAPFALPVTETEFSKELRTKLLFAFSGRTYKKILVSNHGDAVDIYFVDKDTGKPVVVGMELPKGDDDDVYYYYSGVLGDRVDLTDTSEDYMILRQVWESVRRDINESHK